MPEHIVHRGQKTVDPDRTKILEEIIQPHHMSHMPHALSMISMSILDPAFLKRKVFPAYDTDDNHRVT
jgi:hypothetical protein